MNKNEFECSIHDWVARTPPDCYTNSASAFVQETNMVARFLESLQKVFGDRRARDVTDKIFGFAPVPCTDLHAVGWVDTIGLPSCEDDPAWDDAAENDPEVDCPPVQDLIYYLCAIGENGYRGKFFEFPDGASEGAYDTASWSYNVCVHNRGEDKPQRAILLTEYCDGICEWSYIAVFELEPVE